MGVEFNPAGQNPIPAYLPKTQTTEAPANKPAGPTMNGDQLKLSTTAQNATADQPQKTDAEKAADADAQKEGYTDAAEKKIYDQLNDKLRVSRIISKIEEALKDDKKR